jgi:hypothetical protein
MAAEKIFRVVMDDQDGDGKQDMTLQQNGKRIVTVYDWKSILLSWVVSTTALFAAGMGVVTLGFGM